MFQGRSKLVLIFCIVQLLLLQFGLKLHVVVYSTVQIIFTRTVSFVSNNTLTFAN